ncbi:hypothetical protein CAEBREN_21636 [Caenorhabditis brenneri]|uniref:Uncharacterized protein n=1 Tax=Caenorhabditis brenneri TaxID=135651 RepID=G0NQA4_CAEBE|nr:hypothetical protein CAEBREN_21636 [Caenorhabditis brenneri]
MSNLRTVQETQPQRYILWQTIAVLLSKIGLIPLFLFLLYYYYYEPSNIDYWYLYKFDQFTAPLTMQVSYLGCNKKNLEIMFGYIKKKLHIGPNSVEPTIVDRTTEAGRREERVD